MLLCLSWHGLPGAPRNSMQCLPESAICSSSSPSSKRNRFRAGDEIGVACPSALEDLRSSQDLVGHTMPYIMLQRAVTSPGWEYLGMTLNFDGSVALSYVICSIVFMCFQMFFNVFQWHWIKYNKININQQNIIKHRHIQLEHKSCQGLQFLTSAVSQKETQLSWSENHRKTMKNYEKTLFHNRPSQCFNPNTTRTQ